VLQSSSLGIRPPENSRVGVEELVRDSSDVLVVAVENAASTETGCVEGSWNILMSDTFVSGEVTTRLRRCKVRQRDPLA